MIHRVRESSKGDCDNMYADYLAFENNDKCSTIDVWIREWNRHVRQPVMFCYVRAAIIPLDGSMEPPPYEKIAVFPRNYFKMMVFKIHPITKNYKLVHILNNFRWNAFVEIPHSIFNIPVPNSYSKINELYNKLHENVQNLDKKRYV